MGRGGDSESVVRSSGLDDLRKKTEEGMSKDLPGYVDDVLFQEGFIASFLQEARQDGKFEIPKLPGAALRRPALRLTYVVDKKRFDDHDPGLVFTSSENQIGLYFVYLSNRLRPLTEHASGGRVPSGISLSDERGDDPAIPIETVFVGNKELRYSIVIS